MGPIFFAFVQIKLSFCPLGGFLADRASDQSTNFAAGHLFLHTLGYA